MSASGALLSQRRDHHDGPWRLDHDLAEAHEPIHPGHLNVQRHDLRIERSHEFKSFTAVSRQPDVEVPLLKEDFFEQLTHQRRIVGNEQFDHKAFDDRAASSRSNFSRTSVSI